MDLNLDILSKIQKVEVPPFLYTRIQQKIENGNDLTFTKRLGWSLAVSFIIVLVMNVVVLSYKTSQSKDQNNLAQEMGLMPNNTLYK